MKINTWTIFAYCKVGECGAEMIMSLIQKEIQPASVYTDLCTNTPVDNYLILKAVNRIMQGKGIAHRYVCDNSVDYVMHKDNRYTICLENGREWRIRKPSFYASAHDLESFSKYVDQCNQQLIAKHP